MGMGLPFPFRWSGKVFLRWNSLSKDPNEVKEEVVSISVEEHSGRMNGLEVEVYLSCLGKIRRSICMEQNEEERGGSCGLRITGTRQSFGFYSKYGRESFQDFEQKSEGVRFLF